MFVPASRLLFASLAMNFWRRRASQLCRRPLAGPFRAPSHRRSLQWLWFPGGADRQKIATARQLSRIPAWSLGLSPAQIGTSESLSLPRPLPSLLDSSGSWDEPSPHLSMDLPRSVFIVDCVDSRCGYCGECAAATCAIARAN